MSVSLGSSASVRASRRTRPLPAWLAGLVDSTAWFVAILALTVSRFLLADDEIAVDWTPILSNVALLALLSILLAAGPQ